MGRAPCCDKNGLKKGPWTPEEDQKLMDYIQKNGYGNWRTLPKNAGLQRCGKSCRLRWTNYLRPDIKRGRFSFEEEETIIQLHSILGNKWSAIAGRLPGRTDNEIKNYWNTHIRKRLLRMGIDPVTHSPRLDLLDLSNLLNPSLYPSSTTNINFSRLLGVQPFINPDLIRLASSLLSSDRRPLPQNQLFPSCNNQVSPSPTPLPHQNQNELMQYEAPPGFGEWQAEDYGELGNYGYYGSDQSAVDLDGAPAPSSETFQSNTSSSNNNNNFSFQSVLSTPSSSPPSLHSASNCNITTQDQTYCTQMLKFQIPADILDVADFISFPS